MSATRDVFLLLDRVALSARVDVQWGASTVSRMLQASTSIGENRKCEADCGCGLAAIPLNRDEIKNSPVVQAKISDSLRLAEMIVSKMRS